MTTKSLDDLNNPDLEAALFGSILLDPDILPDLVATLQEEFFSRDIHRRIFRAMISIHRRGYPVDALAVSDEMERLNLTAEGDAGYLMELPTQASPGGHRFAYDRVVELAKQRLLINAASTYTGKILNGRMDEANAWLAEQTARINAIGTTNQSRYTSRTISEMRATRKKRDWEVYPMILKRQLVGICGDGGTGKTAVILDILLTKALDGVHVAYVAGEGQDSIIDRFSAWCIARGVDEASVDPYFHVYDEAIPMLRPEHVEEFTQGLLHDGPPEIVVLDTLSRCMQGGEENSNDDMRDFINAMEHVKRATDASVWVLHHANKEGLYRGASAFRDNLDTVIMVTNDEATHITTFKPDKTKDCDPFRPQTWQLQGQCLDEYAELSAVVATRCDVPKRAERLQGNRLKALMAIGEHIALGYNEWLKESGVKEGSWYKVVGEMEKNGYVLQDPITKGYHLTERGRTVHQSYTPSKPSNSLHEGFEGSGLIRKIEPSKPSSPFRDEGFEGSPEGPQKQSIEQCAECGNPVEGYLPNGRPFCKDHQPAHIKRPTMVAEKAPQRSADVAHVEQPSDSRPYRVSIPGIFVRPPAPSNMKQDEDVS